MWGRLRGTRHCSLCDITHSPLRRKPSWDELLARLPVPFTTLHLNEMPADVADVVRTAGAPVVLVRTDADLTVLLDAAALERAGGDVQRFEQVLRSRLEAI